MSEIHWQVSTPDDPTMPLGEEKRKKRWPRIVTTFPPVTTRLARWRGGESVWESEENLRDSVQAELQLTERTNLDSRQMPAFRTRDESEFHLFDIPTVPPKTAETVGYSTLPCASTEAERAPVVGVFAPWRADTTTPSRLRNVRKVVALATATVKIKPETDFADDTPQYFEVREEADTQTVGDRVERASQFKRDEIAEVKKAVRVTEIAPLGHTFEGRTDIRQQGLSDERNGVKVSIRTAKDVAKYGVPVLIQTLAATELPEIQTVADDCVKRGRVALDCKKAEPQRVTTTAPEDGTLEGVTGKGKKSRLNALDKVRRDPRVSNRPLG